MATTWGQAKLIRHCRSSNKTSRAKTHSSTWSPPASAANWRRSSGPQDGVKAEHERHGPHGTLLEAHRPPGQVGQNQMVTGTQPLGQRRQLLVVATAARPNTAKRNNKAASGSFLSTMGLSPCPRTYLATTRLGELLAASSKGQPSVLLLGITIARHTP
jgi:hypothetical protein